MKIVPATEAKAKFSALLSDVERGETVDITRHGRTIARIVPPEGFDRERARKAVEALEELRTKLPKSGITIEDILEARHEGHKY
ncbi:type II toxin-antitoxin system prevent-host-death family antitoxin [Aquamicrobium sp. LC103]|uniref:type II toxin-antitoxin system Phd/YefM family antitoxin n=1 Tax=Aquamicrobium sp. LC103 TaxID=1120658 RepID=UPI00063E8CD2|nr:type II toxin-antitoxin system prevent-host-death family antitoxin [Aquamicrobium sp. LC103]TKT80944.1 type II toxin-antitoxin system Phd/YefM family antitoxin [Aquamicrobium sp. LC103]